MINDLERRRRDMMRNTIRDKIRNDPSFPAFPASVQKLNAVLARQDSGISEVARIIEMDPGLAARCLKLANSAAYSSTVRISNIQTALSRIGMREVRRMVMSISVVGSMSRLRVQVDWTRFWLHSLLTARLGEIITGAYQDVSGKAYLAGLIHDIGKLFIEHYFPNEFSSILLQGASTPDEVTRHEQRILGLGHGDICAMIADQWKLDADIGCAVRTHHDVAMAGLQATGITPECRTLCLCMSLANRLANIVGENISTSGHSPDISLETLPEWQYLGQLVPCRELELNLDDELQRVRETLDVILAKPAAA